nr:reverse transcriptase domain-containing protein [Tanacetum cinerariifolium]
RGLRGQRNNQNHFNQNQNRGNNFNHGPVYQPSVFQPPAYQAPTYQAPAPQTQGVSKEDFSTYVKANDAVMRNMQTQGQNMQNQLINLTDLLTKFVNFNNASTSSSGTLPSNTIANPRSDLKSITTRSGMSYDGPQILPLTSFLPKVVENKPEATKDTVRPTNNESTKDVQPQVVQSKSPILTSEPVNFPISEPVNSPVSAPRPNLRPPIPYPSIMQDQKLHDKANDQREKFFQIFKDLNFNISFADALILMPNEAWDRFKDLLRACPRHGFSELHQLDTFYNALNSKDQDSLNFAAGGNFLDKMPRKCLAIIESKSKVTYSRNKPVVAKVSSNTSTYGISPDVSELKDMVPQIPPLTSFLSKVVENEPEVTKDTVHPTNNESTEDVQPSVVQSKSLILTSELVNSLISKPVAYPISAPRPNLKPSIPYPSRMQDQKLRDKANDQQVDDFLAIEDDPTLPEVDQSYLDPEGDILLLEAFLDDDPLLPPPNQGNYLPEVRKEPKIREAKSNKSLIDEPPEVELKDLPPHLEYAFLEGDDKLPVIIVKDLRVEEKTALITVLKSHKRAIAWKLSYIKGIDPEL